MKSYISIEVEVTHDGTSTTNEIADMFQLEIEQHNQGIKDNPDDFGATKYLVIGLSYRDSE